VGQHDGSASLRRRRKSCEQLRSSSLPPCTPLTITQALVLELHGGSLQTRPRARGLPRILTLLSRHPHPENHPRMQCAPPALVPQRQASCVQRAGTRFGQPWLDWTDLGCRSPVNSAPLLAEPTSHKRPPVEAIERWSSGGCKREIRAESAD